MFSEEWFILIILKKDGIVTFQEITGFKNIKIANDICAELSKELKDILENTTFHYKVIVYRKR